VSGGRHHYDDGPSTRWRAPDETGEWTDRGARHGYEPEIAGHDDLPAYGRHHEPGGGRRRRADDTGGWYAPSVPDTGSWQAPSPRDTGSWPAPSPRDTGSWEMPRPAREYGGRRRAPDGADTGQWEHMTDTGQYVRTATTGDWDRLTDTGSHERDDWDRLTDTGAHRRAINWDRLTDSGSHSLADDRAQERFDAFWSGHRLAGDDPRWMPTPSSAPHSPAVSIPERRRNPDADPRRDAVPRRRPDGISARDLDALPRPRAPQRTAAAAPTRRTTAATAPARRPATAPRRRPTRDHDLELENTRVFAVLLYTAIWYAVPVLVFGIWLLTLDGSTPASCVSDVTGGGCDSARDHAFESLGGGLPYFGLALGASLVIAIVLRWIGRGWRAGSIGLAAAVVGGGLSTVLLSAVSGQPIG
jgi:hypothetical protein